MMQIITMQAQPFDQFVAAHPYGHYMKTSMWGLLQEKQGCRCERLGLLKDGRLQATALVLTKTTPWIRWQYVPWGPCVDYEDEALSQEVMETLIAHARDSRVDFLRCDPNVLRMEKDIRGNPVEGGENHENITAMMKRLGFVHRGYGYAYNGSWVNRFTLIIDLKPSVAQIVQRFSKARLNSLRRHEVIGVSTRTGGRQDLPALCEFERQLAQIQGFQPHPQAFFEQLLQVFGDHAVLYVTSIDLCQMIAGIDGEIQSGKYHKDPEALRAKQKEKEKAAALMQKYGSHPDIAAGLFIRLGHQSWDLYTYNHKEFNFVKAVDQLHRFAVEDMKNHGVTQYDMCGFSGVTDRSDPYFGLYDYKRSFGSVYTERIGEFDFNFHPRRKALWQKGDHYRRRLRRKVMALWYGKKAKK